MHRKETAMASTADEKYTKIYVETIRRTDGERLRARWTCPVTGKSRNKVLGTLDEFPNPKTNKCLQTMLNELSLQVNHTKVNLAGYTVNNLIAEYLEKELVPRQPGEDTGYSASYINRTVPVIRKHIQPRYGKELLKNMGRQ